MKFEILILLFAVTAALAAPDYQLQTLEEAHALFRAASNTTQYAEAAKQYEYLVNEDQIQNGQLFYTLGNAYFLANDLGRAILNYRRAETFIPGNDALRHNLETALGKRIDLIDEKERNPFIEKLLGWHFNTSPRTRWWLFAGCWLAGWGAWGWHRRRPTNESRITLIVLSALTLVLAISLIVERVLSKQSAHGVIIDREVLARKGDGEMYAPAFLDPLHAGTEFHRIEDRGDWWDVRLANDQTCWIPAHAAKMVKK